MYTSLLPALSYHAVLQGGLESNFRDVSVCVVDCPDLTQPPWKLAAPGHSISVCVKCSNTECASHLLHLIQLSIFKC